MGFAFISAGGKKKQCGQKGKTHESLMEIKVNCSSPRDFWWLIDLAYRTGGISCVPLNEEKEAFLFFAAEPDSN